MKKDTHTFILLYSPEIIFSQVMNTIKTGIFDELCMNGNQSVIGLRVGRIGNLPVPPSYTWNKTKNGPRETENGEKSNAIIRCYINFNADRTQILTNGTSDGTSGSIYFEQ
jgi:hypothetical protein